MNERLIAAVIEQIKEDLLVGDLTAIEELLENLSEEFLLAYLPGVDEEKHYEP